MPMLMTPGLPGFGPGAQRRPRLLLVDDEPLIIQMLHQVFDGLYDLSFATTGARAMALCLESPPDLILTDVAMPDMSGLQLCRDLKKLDATRGVPVLFVTGSTTMEGENACWAAGCVDFIAKPINPETIRHRVHAHLTLKLQADMLRQLAYIDGLTGVANRRYFDDMLATEWRRCLRNGHDLSLALVDVDFFKRYNDSYGHQAGDDCLRAVAGALRGSLQRPQDLAARYGGEEFACLMPQTDADGAMQVGAQLEAAVRGLQMAHRASDAAGIVTVSVGVATLAPTAGTDAAALLRQADDALYGAKSAGRGRVQGAGRP